MLGIELPEKIDYVITSTEPAVKGNTATGATKDAIIETGLLVRVPLFIEEGEEIIVSINDIEVLEGQISSKQQKMVLGWAAFHQTELLEDWELAASKQELFPIAPLN